MNNMPDDIPKALPIVFACFAGLSGTGIVIAALRFLKKVDLSASYTPSEAMLSAKLRNLTIAAPLKSSPFTIAAPLKSSPFRIY